MEGINLYQAKVAYDTQNEDFSGGMQRVRETYLVKATNFTEAETRLVAYLTSYPYASQHEVKSLGIIKTEAVITSPNCTYEDPIYAKVKVATEDIDVKTGRTKVTNTTLVIKVDELKQVFGIVANTYQMTDHRIVSITDMQVMDFIE